MAKQTVNIGSTANDGTGDQLRTAFEKLNQNNDEIYGNNFVTEGMLNDDIVGADELKVTGDGTAGQILTSDGDGTFSWATGVTGDITGVEAGDGLTGGGTGGDVTLDIGAGTGITVTADAVSLATSVQDEIDLNTAKTGITPTQASDITTNNSKVSDQTVVLTEGANVTITGTYPNFTIASDDVVGAVTSVNGDAGVVVLDTLDIAENTNLYYTEARVSANTDVAANTAKTGITPAQAADIVTNNAKNTDQTVTLTEGANVTITGTYPDFTIASDDVVGAVNSVNGDTGVVVLGTDDVDEGSSNLYYTEARVSANSAVAANTAKTGITTQQASDIAANNAKNTDQTVTLTNAGNITIGGTYPDFTIASADVVGAVTSVNGEVGVVALDTSDIAENTNLYYTEARVAANSAVALNTAKTGITTSQADDITDNNAKVSNATHTGDVTGDVALTIADNVVDAAKLDVTGNGTAGQLLQSDGDGSMTWVTGVTGDITAVTAGDGLTGGGTGGDVTLNVVGGDGITASADEISLSTSVAGDGLTLTSGVLSVDTIETGDIADDAITSPKLALFDDNLAATDTHILVANGTDFFNKAMSGDATLANTGAITIADDAIDTDKILDDAVTADKLADSINTDIATGVAKVSFPGFGNTTGTALEGDTDLLVLGNSGTTALAGNTTTITAQQISDITSNNNKITNATHTGEVTGSGALTITDGAVVADRLATDAVTTVKILDANVTTDKIADVNVTTAKLANGAVSHDKLEDRYTEAVSVTTLTGAYSLDWSTGAIFVMSGSLTGNIEFDFTNFKVGQTIDIYNLTGAHTVTFDSDAATSETFNKCGGVDYAGASTNLIQVQCVDDSATAVFNYAVSAYVSDTTPS